MLTPRLDGQLQYDKSIRWTADERRQLTATQEYLSLLSRRLNGPVAALARFL